MDRFSFIGSLLALPFIRVRKGRYIPVDRFSLSTDENGESVIRNEGTRMEWWWDDER